MDSTVMEWGNDFRFTTSQHTAVRMAAGPKRGVGKNAITKIMPLGPLLFVSAADGRVSIWDAKSLEYVSQLKVSDLPVTDIITSAMVPIITASEDGSVQFWSM